MGSGKTPDDFTVNGWNKANGYLMKMGDYNTPLEYKKEKFRRAAIVRKAFIQTDEGKKAVSLAVKESWKTRVMKAKATSDTTEVLLLEALTKIEDGITTSELVAGCINMIARELSRRGVQQIEELSLKDLVLISNSLIGLTKAAAATKKETNWQPQVQVNNVTVNNTSKTGGVVGGLKDVIDLRTQKTPRKIEAEVSR